VASVVWPFDPSNKSGFLISTLLVFENCLSAQVSGVVLLCIAVILAFPSAARIRALVLVFGLAAVLYMVLQLLLGCEPGSLDVQVLARTLNFSVPLFATLFLFVFLLKRTTIDSKAIGAIALLTGSLGLAQSFWSIEAASRWSGMLATLRYEL